LVTCSGNGTLSLSLFPSDTGLRRLWEVVLKLEGFVVGNSSVLCSEHFKPDHFDRTIQIVRCIFTLHPNRDIYVSTEVNITLC
uniref:THAP-type domain-containing protein n=1 Tax=Gouania willdenowi TaxID=441366 RepID=A0A8C5DZM9_GOUWI